jgi:hypothetical protein
VTPQLSKRLDYSGIEGGEVGTFKTSIIFITGRRKMKLSISF